MWDIFSEGVRKAAETATPKQFFDQEFLLDQRNGRSRKIDSAVTEEYEECEAQAASTAHNQARKTESAKRSYDQGIVSSDIIDRIIPMADHEDGGCTHPPESPEKSTNKFA